MVLGHPSCGLADQCWSLHIGAPQPERTLVAGSHATIHKPQLLACAGCSCRKNLSPSICFVYNSHTKVKCLHAPHVQRSPTFLNPSLSSATVTSLPHRGDPTCRISCRLTLTGSQTVPSAEIHGSAGPEVKTSWPAQRTAQDTRSQPRVCSVCPRAFISMPRHKLHIQPLAWSKERLAHSTALIQTRIPRIPADQTNEKRTGFCGCHGFVREPRLARLRVGLLATSPTNV